MFVFGGFNLSSFWAQCTFRFLLGTLLSQASPTCLQPAPGAPGPGPMDLTFRRWSSFPTPSVCGRRPWVWRHRAGDFLDQRRGTQVCRMVWEVGFKNHQSPRFFLQVSDFDWYPCRSSKNRCWSHYSSEHLLVPQTFTCHCNVVKPTHHIRSFNLCTYLGFILGLKHYHLDKQHRPCEIKGLEDNSQV